MFATRGARAGARVGVRVRVRVRAADRGQERETVHTIMGPEPGIRPGPYVRVPWVGMGREPSRHRRS